MYKVEFDIKIKAGFEAKELDESCSHKELIKDIKIDLAKDFKNWYGLNVSEIDVKMNIEEHSKNEIPM